MRVYSPLVIIMRQKRWERELKDMEIVMTSRQLLVGFSKHYFYLLREGEGILHLRRKPRNEEIYLAWIDNVSVICHVEDYQGGY